MSKSLKAMAIAGVVALCLAAGYTATAGGFDPDALGFIAGSCISEVEGRPLVTFVQVYNSDGDLVSEVTTEADGLFWADDLVPGTYDIFAIDPRYDGGGSITQVEVFAYETTKVTVWVLDPTG